MYVNNFPCADCARAIIQSGISQLNSFAPEMTDVNFARHYRAAETMLLESGVDVRLFHRQDASIAEARKRFLTGAR
jgi:dCMP deaminase